MNGQFDGYIGTDLDITESKKAIESLNRYQNLAEITDDIILFIDLDGKIVDVNKSAVKAYGYTYEELCSINIRDIRADWGYTKKQMEIANKTGIFFEAMHRRKDGSCFDVEVSSRGTDMDNSRILASIVRDVTERKLAVQNLKESERSKSVLLSNLPGMAYRCNYDKAWTMQFVSDGCFELTGYSPEDLLGNNKLSYNDLINSEYREYLWEKLTQLLPVKGVLKEEYMITTSTGEIKWVYEQARGIYDDNDNVIALEGLIIDVTDRKKKEDEILYLNYHDVLTGLYNRRFFEKKKKQIDIDSKLPLSVIIGDINGLKQVNDALGHAQGDKLLLAVSKVIKSCMRKQDILARTGGDDFSILLPNTSNEEANEIMKQTELACDEYNSNAIYHTSISFGCATKTDLNEDMNDILKLADDNMYQQKLLKKESFHSSVIASMKTSLLEKNQETEQHAQRLILLSKAIGMKLNLSDKQLNELELLSMLHDIGKIGINDNILNKSDILTYEEWSIMKKHPEIGYRIAMSIPELKPIAKYILCHHERYDGKGYPKGIKGEDIPLLSRIIAIVDSYDAMTEDRIYRKAIPKEVAINEIKLNIGTQFDPEIANIFIDILSESLIFANE